MAGSIKNVIVGAAQLFLSVDQAVGVAGVTDVSVQRQELPALVAGTPAGTTINGSANWRDVGFTTNGLALAYTPTYGSVTVDQLKDAAALFSTDLTVEATTELAEPTLENIRVVWGQDSTTQTTAGGDDILNINASALGAYPVEHSLAAVGNAPRTAAGGRRERVYFARRVVSVSASTSTLARTDATTVPVTFRLLPDPAYAGAEYGRIIDRTL